MPQSKFTPAQAEELADAFAHHEVEYLFIGKSGAILLGYPDTTQDVDIFLPRSRHNAERVLRARAENFEAAKKRSVLEEGRFPVASLDDIIASKRATGREKDLQDVKRLERFRQVRRESQQ